MYMLGLLLGMFILWAISFVIFVAIVRLICWALAIKFVLRYAIAAWLICSLLKWVWDTK